jgi:heme/copper-type cytochrome/quinol oxidase subunit 1
MYMVLGLVMLLRGFADAIMMRLQQATAFGGSEGYLSAHHYDQIFTAHGVIMIFFVAMWLVTGLMNYIVPLQMVQVAQRGLTAANERLMCLSLFWHFLDIIWIGVFTFVYLMGMLR